MQVISYPNPTSAPIALPPRAHNDAEVVLWCRAGRAEIAVDDGEIVLEAGDALWIATGVEHAVIAEAGSVVVPALLPAGSDVRERWMQLRGVPARLHPLLLAAKVDAFSLITVSEEGRRVLRDRILAVFQRPTTILAGPPAAQSPWIETEVTPMLLWCAHGDATVMLDEGEGACVRGLRVGTDQAVSVPPGIAHRVRTEPGGVVIPVMLAEQEGVADGAHARLRHITTRSRLGMTFSAVSQFTGLRPMGQDEDEALVLRGDATDVTLRPVVETSAAHRVQHIQRALHSDPGHSATLGDWASAFAVSARSIERNFLSHAGRGFGDWRQELRMHHAASWLDEGRQAKWVSNRLGFAHLSAFSRAFSRHFGVSVRDHQHAAHETVQRLH